MMPSCCTEFPCRAVVLVVLGITMWLSSVEGLSISPKFTPEAVIQNQLRALQQDDLESVFQYASPSNKAATGPWERFAEMIRSPPYAPLIRHRRGEVLMTISVRDSYRRCLVRVWPEKGRRRGAAKTAMCIEYWWDLSRIADDGLYRDCWMVESVMQK